MPTGRHVPCGGVQAAIPPPNTGGRPYVTGTQFELHGTVKVSSFVGQRIDGGGTGRTVMVKVHSERAQALLASQTTAVTPIGKQVPRGGLHLTSTPLFTTGRG